MNLNIATPDTYYSQRNNKLDPFGSCNVTSIVTALAMLKVPFPKGKFDQPEDNLYDFIKSNNKVPTVHDDLRWGVNEWIGRKIDTFTMSFPIEKLWNELKENRPVVMSGTFPGYPVKMKSPLGHIVVLVGVDIENDIPESVYFNDPYGSTMNNWKASGYNIKIPYNLFIEWMKPLNDTKVKWAHSFSV